MPEITLTVNGRKHMLTVDDPDAPLLWVLRDNLGLTGTKFGCGIGECGACTVLIDGDAIKSCQRPASQAAGKKITTIEGLSPNHTHALQRAWIAEEAPQCGYCQCGMIMAAAGLLKQTPHPTDQEITDAMRYNICRCGTYARIRRAIKRAAMATAIPPRKQAAGSGKPAAKGGRGK